MQHPSQGSCSCAHGRRQALAGIKFDLPARPPPQGRERPRERAGRVRGVLRGQFTEARHGHSPDTHAAAASTQDTQRTQRRREGGQLARGSVRETRGRAVKKGGRDRDRGRVSERFKSRAVPALVSPVLREHPAVAPPPPPLGFLRSPSLPGRRRRRLKGTAAPRCPATSGAAAELR